MTLRDIIKNRFSFVVLGALILISTALHFMRISYPSRPAFDEAYFATFAADYLYSKPHLDIHPPLGKLIYATFLAPYVSSFTSTTFVSTSPDLSASPGETKIKTMLSNQSFGDYPYVSLRIVSAFFGVLLILATYFFTLSLSKNTYAALFSAFFVAFDNALLLETRLILLNGMYLVFALFAFAFFFDTRRSSVLGGVLWGLALNIKLVPVVFAGLLFPFFFKRHFSSFFFRRAIVFGTVAYITFLVSLFVTSNLFIPARANLTYLSQFMPDFTMPDLSQKSLFVENMYYRLGVPIVQLSVSLSGYTHGLGEHPYESKWYEWPIMKGVMVYHGNTEGTAFLMLLGNPVVWSAALVGVIGAGVLLLRGAWLGLNGSFKNLESRIPPSLKATAGHSKNSPFAKGFGGAQQKLGILRMIYPGITSLISRNISRAGASVEAKDQKIHEDRVFTPYAVLLAGYVVSLLPFILFVRRVAFLYHYFPALIFGISLVSILIADYLKNCDIRRRRIVILCIISLVLIGFTAVAPLTYGLQNEL